MKALIGVATFGITLALVAGCDWQAGGNQFNTSQGEIDFAGLYTPGSPGGWLVSNYSQYGSTNAASTNVTSKGIGTGDGATVFFSGNLGTGIVPASLTITVGGLGMITTDNTGAMTAVGSFTVTGQMDYNSGAYTFTLGTAPAAGEALTANFSMLGSTAGQQLGPGGSSIIDTFNVEQSGGSLRIIDNNGSVYTGSLGAYATVGTVSSNITTTGIQNTGGQTVTAQFEASGVSSAGMNVQMTGNFQAQNSQSIVVPNNIPFGVTNVPYTVENTWNRNIYGTWLEQGGRNGDINGQATPVVTSGTQSTGSTGG